MDIAQTGGLSLEFEGAILSPAPDHPVPARAYRIGWLLKGREVESASIRYRCFHFARVLAPQFESLYFTSAGQLQDSLADLDAVVIVKRIDKAVPALVAKARYFHVPVFLDLCDDMLAPGYVKNEYGVNLTRFLGIAPLLAGVTVPSAEMADRVYGYAFEHGYRDISVHVIPDIAETWDLYRATAKFAGGVDLPAKLEPAGGSADRKRVVWFGNYGASHSNFGIFSLKPSLKSLKAVNEEIPLELTVISNSEDVFEALIRDSGIPARYVAWSPSVVYAELALADVALLTSGDDDFCDIKSSCRVLQAFAAGVPVVSAKGSALSEFEEAIAIGRMQDALRNCLGPKRGRFVPPRLEGARRVLERYTPERIGGIWSQILKAAIARSEGARERSLGARGKVLFLVEPGDDRRSVTTLLSTAKRTPGLDYTTLVSTDLLAKHPEFGPALRLSRNIPRFFSGQLEGGRNLLLGCSALVVERPSAPVAKLLGAYARELGVRIFTAQEALKRGLGKFVRPPNAPGGARNIHATPFQEGLNADGSVDWAFVVHEKGRGWILDAICREIGSRQPASWSVFYYPEEIPKAKNLFFSHYALFQPFLEQHPEKMEDANIFVWYTHPREEDPVTVAQLLLALEKATKVIFACESNRQIWLERGLPEEKTAVILGAADPALFRFHERGGGVIGLSSSFYERKNPDCLLKLIKLLPHRQFLLLGRRWNQYALFEEMRALPNFTYKSASYREYPEIYSTFDVFLSMSTLEGGPIPLVEAMMSNAVPVASRTGFAPDLIRNGENGFIFDLDASAEEIAGMIEQAFATKANIRQTVEHYSWNNFSSEIVKLTQ